MAVKQYFLSYDLIGKIEALKNLATLVGDEEALFILNRLYLKTFLLNERMEEIKNEVREGNITELDGVEQELSEVMGKMDNLFSTFIYELYSRYKYVPREIEE